MSPKVAFAIELDIPNKNPNTEKGTKQTETKSTMANYHP